MSQLQTFSLVLGASLLAVGCGKAEFKSFSVPGEKISVEMPGAPKATSQTMKGVQFTTHTVEEREGAYAVSVILLPVRTGETEEQTQTRLDGAVTGMMRSAGASLTNSTRIALDGKFLGRDVTAALPNNKGTLRARVYLVGPKLCQGIVVGTNRWASSPEATKFLHSMKTLP
jgi:hypothetical protein